MIFLYKFWYLYNSIYICRLMHYNYLSFTSKPQLHLFPFPGRSGATWTAWDRSSAASNPYSGRLQNWAIFGVFMSVNICKYYSIKYMEHLGMINIFIPKRFTLWSTAPLDSQMSAMLGSARDIWGARLPQATYRKAMLDDALCWLNVEAVVGKLW
jgi:hypothetical protein